MKKLLILAILAQGIASLAKKKSLIPSFRWVIEVVHCLKGRIRLFIPLLKGKDNIVLVRLKELRKIDAVKTFEFSTVTGSLLVVFDEQKIDPFLLMSAIIQVLGLESEITKGCQSRLSKEAGDILDSINRGIYDKTAGFLDLKSGVTLLLISSLIYTQVRKQYALGAQATLLWWLYDSLKAK